MIKDFCNTLTECCIHLLPRSIFPFECVPMTRVDPIDDGRQVMMDNRFNINKYGGRIFRPGVIPRNLNPWIVTPNFSLQCKGKIFSGVLEDEMYMSDIVSKALEMDIPWYKFPLDQCSSRSIYWEYGVSFPMCR